MDVITLVSAVAGDCIGEAAIELAQLGERPAWLHRPEVQQFFADNNYGPDADWAELMYVLVGDQTAPVGLPVLKVELDDVDVAQVREAYKSWFGDGAE
jgi:hypothetical protein